jgi:hypothetical protein
MHAYTAKVAVQVTTREINISIQYVLDAKYGDKYKIELPARNRLTSITYQNRGLADYSRTADTIWLAAISNTNDNRIQLAYSLPVRDIDFVLTNWLPRLSEDGSLTATIIAPDKYRAAVIPFETNDGGSFTFSQEDWPIIFCGKYNALSETVGDTKVDVLYPFKAGFSAQDAAAAYRAFQDLVFPLAQKNLYLIQLSDLPNLVRFSSSTVFVTMNAASPEELRRTLAAVWFRGSLRLPDDASWALVDLYRRLIGENGERTVDDGALVPVPSADYYRKVLKSGFPTKGETECDVNAMLKNFALLDFAYYTLGMDAFTAGMKRAVSNFLASSSTNETLFTDVAGEDAAVAGWVARQFLPVASTSPDYSLKKTTAYRSMDNLPDVEISGSDSNVQLAWGGKRGVEVTGLSGMLVIDPKRRVPQLNYFNDRSYLDPKEAAEADAAYLAATAHRHYDNESFREILDMTRLKAEAGNSFGVPAGADVFVAVVKFYAPVRNRLTMGLKEMLITVADGKGTVIADRVRL